MGSLRLLFLLLAATIATASRPRGLGGRGEDVDEKDFLTKVFSAPKRVIRGERIVGQSDRNDVFDDRAITTDRTKRMIGGNAAMTLPHRMQPDRNDVFDVRASTRDRTKRMFGGNAAMTRPRRTRIPTGMSSPSPNAAMTPTPVPETVGNPVLPFYFFPIVPAGLSPQPTSSPNEGPEPPTPAPTPQLTSAPTPQPTTNILPTPALEPTIPPIQTLQPIGLGPGFPACAVCGSELVVENPRTIFPFPGQGDVTCGQLELAGIFGFVDPLLCPSLPPSVATNCGCIPIGANSPSNSPSAAPSSGRMAALPSSIPTTYWGSNHHKITINRNGRGAFARFHVRVVNSDREQCRTSRCVECLHDHLFCSKRSELCQLILF